MQEAFTGEHKNYCAPAQHKHSALSDEVQLPPL